MGERLTGRVALVTGAASGIGRACVEALACEGAAVMATDIDRAGLEETLAIVRARHGRAEMRLQDVTDEARWTEIVTETGRVLGPLSIAVMNAGIGIAAPILELTLADWRRQMAVNLDSVFLGTRAVIPAIAAAGGGSIVNMSSVAGLRGSAGLSAYCASKGGVRLFTKAIALECARAGLGIRVNSVHPGIIRTPIWQKEIVGMVRLASEAQLEGLGTTRTANAIEPEALARLGVPGGVAGEPRDIADVVVFLASDESRYITGAEIVVDAGMSA